MLRGRRRKGFKTVATPVEFAAHPQRTVSPAPELGGDTEAVLEKLSVPPMSSHES